MLRQRFASPLLVCTLASTTALMGAQCTDTGGEDAGPPATATSGCGEVTSGGTTTPYALDVEQSRLLLMLGKNRDGVGCGLFHNHTVRARSASYTYTFNRDAPGTSTLTATVFTAGLDNDDPADFGEFPETASGETPAPRDRAKIRANMMQEVEAAAHPEMTFTATNLSTLDGAGTATVTVRLKGVDSTFTMDATATWTGDQLTIDGTGTLDGRPHNTPRSENGLNRCMVSSMPLKMHLVFKPVASCVVDENKPDAGPAYVAAFIPPTGACATGTGDAPSTGFHTVDSTLGVSPQDVLLMRCGGCHSSPSRLGATVPLISFEDMRTDTAVHPGVPRAQVAVELSDPALALAGDSLAMPPPLDGMLPQEEYDLLKRWFDQGAHRTACDAMGAPEAVPAPRTRTPVTPANCAPAGTPIYEDVRCVFGALDADGGVDPGCDLNTSLFACAACHAQGSPTINLAEFAGGAVPVMHAGFRTQDGYTDGGTLHPGLSGWEVALARMKDNSMPPGGLFLPSDDPQLVLVEQWVNAGYPESRCP